MESQDSDNVYSEQHRNSKAMIEVEMGVEREKNKSHIKSNKFIEARNKIYFNGTPQIQHINSVNPELFNSNVSESNNCYSDNTDTGNVYLQTNPPINYSNQPNAYPQQSYPYYYDPQGMYNTTSVYETSNLQYGQQSYEESFEGQYLQHPYPPFNPPPPPAVPQSGYIPTYYNSQNLPNVFIPPPFIPPPPPPPESPKDKSKESHHHHHKSKKRDKNSENVDKENEKDQKQDNRNDNNKILLKNLPYNVEEERILNICSIAGEVESIKVHHPSNEEGRSECEIIFKDKESINEAKEIFEDSILDDLKPEVIILNDVKDDDKNKEYSKDDEIVYRIKIDGINKDTTEKVISDLFGILGNLKSCKIIENENRYGLVEYSNEESANKAIQKFNGRSIKGSKVTVNWYNERITKNKILLKNLPYNIEEERILNICSVAGELESVKIKHAEDENGRSECEIIFKDKESVNEAKEILEDSDFDGLKAEVIIDEDDEKNKNDSDINGSDEKEKDKKEEDIESKDKKEDDIVIEDISKNEEVYYAIEVDGINKATTKEMIINFFNPIKNLKSCEISRDSKYAILKYSNEESAVKAIERFNGTNFYGSKITVSWNNKVSRNRNTDIKPKSAPAVVQTHNPLYAVEKSLLINNIFSKKEVEDIFSKYEKKSIIDLADGSYQIYLNGEDASKTMSELNGKEYNDKKILLEWGNERRVKRELNTVFVGCLDEKVNDEDLRKVFSQIGEIESMKIFRQKVRGKSPDYAYINFKDKKNIDKAIQLLNGIEVNGRFITVQYPKKKK